MSSLSFDILRSYYINDPAAFLSAINGNSSIAQIYKNLINQIILDISFEFSSYQSKIVRLDMDGNIMFSNDDGNFGQTKNDVKTLCSRVEKVSSSEILVADAIGKRAFIIETSINNIVGAIQSIFVETPVDQDIQFLNDVFGNVDIVLTISKTIWEYQSSRYITSFYLVPVAKRTIGIYNDAIRNELVIARQGDTIEWVNQSSRPISIYSGSTSHDEFNFNPNLSLYGDIFSSSAIEPGQKYVFEALTVGEYDWFVYPDILTGKFIVTRDRINDSDKFILSESDNLDFPFSSRIIEIDSWGNVLKSFGEGYLVKPRDCRPLLNGNLIVST